MSQETREIPLPDLDADGQEITLAAWLKQPGDSVNEGDIIAEVVTDKANVEIESPFAGTLETLLVEEGETVLTGQAIARIATLPA